MKHKHSLLRSFPTHLWHTLASIFWVAQVLWIPQDLFPIETLAKSDGSTKTLATIQQQIQHGDTVEAYHQLNRYLQENPTDSQGYKLMLALCEENHRFDQGIEFVTKALSQSSMDSFWFIKGAQFYQQLDKPSEALALLRTGQRYYPTHPDILMELGTTLRNQEDYVRALEVFKVGQSLVIDVPDFPAEVAYTLYGLGEVNQAIEPLERLFTQFPDDARIAWYLGWITYQEGLYYKSLDIWKTSLSYNKTEVRFQLYLGLTYLKINDIDHATEQFNLLADNPSSCTTGWMALADMYVELKQPHRALEFYEKVIQADPNDTDALIELGGIYLMVNQLDQAYKVYQSVLRIQPSHTSAKINMGWIYCKRHRYQEAFDFNKMLGEEYPNNPTILLNYGLAAIYLNRWEEANQAIQKALDLGEQIYSHLYRSVLYLVQDQTDKALEELKTSFENDRSSKILSLTHDILEEPAFLSIFHLSEFKNLVSTYFQ